MLERLAAKPAWKARFRSSIIDVDTSLVADPALKAFLLAGDSVKAMNWIERHGPSLEADAARLVSAASAGGVVTLVTRANQKVCEALGLGLGNGVVSSGHKGDFRFLIEWLDKNSDARGDHAVLTGSCADAANVADVAWGTRSNLAAVLSSWDDEFSEKPGAEALERRLWALLGCPKTPKRARRMLAVNGSRSPIIEGVNDHGAAYAADYAYPQLKDFGIQNDLRTVSKKILRHLKDGPSEGRAQAALEVAKELVLPRLARSLAYRDSPFVIVPMVSSTPIGDSEKRGEYVARQSSYYVALAVQEAAGGKKAATIAPALVRYRAPDKPKGSRNKSDDSVQVHVESLRVDGDFAEEVDDRDVLLVDDVLTCGTQMEAAESVLRTRCDPRTVTKFAAGRTVNGSDRVHAVKERLREAGASLLEVASSPLILPYEAPPSKLAGARFDHRKWDGKPLA